MRDEHQQGIGRLIARLRDQQGWSQRALAEWVGLDQSAVSRIEAGRRRLTSAELQRFADVFRVSADTLLSGSPSAAPSWAPAQVLPVAAAPTTPSPTTAPAAPAPPAPADQAPAAAAPAQTLRLSAALELPASDHGLTAATVAPPQAPGTLLADDTVPDGSDKRVHGFSAAGSRDDDKSAFLADREAVLGPGGGPSPAESFTDFVDDFDPAIKAPSAGARVPEAPASPAQPHGLRLSAPRLFSSSTPPPGPPFALAASGHDWSADIASVVRDWFRLRSLAETPGPEPLWSTGWSADGRPARAVRPIQPGGLGAPGGDVLYDRVARFWRAELHVAADDGPLPDLVPLLEGTLGVQVIVARVVGPSRETAAPPARVVGPSRDTAAPSARAEAEPATARSTSAAAQAHPVAAVFLVEDVIFLFVNAARPVVLQRYALAHAFAHLVLGHGDVVDDSIGWSRANPREAAANDFAEELLAPVRAVQRWYEQHPLPYRHPTVDTLLELANAFGISAWAALFRSRAAERLNPKQAISLRNEMRRREWELLPQQAYLGGMRDTLAHLTPDEVRPPGAFGGPEVLRVPGAMRVWALAAVRDGHLSLEDAAATLHLEAPRLANQLAALGLE